MKKLEPGDNTKLTFYNLHVTHMAIGQSRNREWDMFAARGGGVLELQSGSLG